MPTSSLPDAVREFAQVPDRYTWLSTDVERHVEDRYGIIQGTVWAGVFGVRAGDGDVAALLEEVRARIPPHKDAAWWIDPDSTPGDLMEQLVALGLEVPETGHVLHAMACVEEPPPAAPGIDVTRVEAFDDHLTATELMWEAFETPAAQRDRQRVHLREEFEAQQESQVPVTFLARVDGRPAGTARSVYSDRGVFLIAGSVLPWARGRGVYRALVRARWDDAVARGTPALVTEAMRETSYPILAHLGFQEVCVIRRVRDSGRQSSGSTSPAS